jgi:hypothetical protein
MRKKFFFSCFPSLLLSFSRGRVCEQMLKLNPGELWE